MGIFYYVPYGTWPHGDKKLSVDRKNNHFNSPKIEENTALEAAMEKSQAETTLFLNEQQRKIALQSIKYTCIYFDWPLIAANVLSNHVHILLRAEENVDKILMKLKSYATRELKVADDTLFSRKKFWARHGSTKYIWFQEHLLPTFYYVVEEQGDKNALYFDEALYSSLDVELYAAITGKSCG